MHCSRGDRRRPFALRIPRTFRDQLAQLAEKRGESMNDMICQMLSDRVAQLNKQQQD